VDVMDAIVTICCPTIATPFTSPFGLNNWMPVKIVPLGTGTRGPPLETGVGSVTKSFIWTIPPGGADSSGMCSEICRVVAGHDAVGPGPPLVDPDVPVELVVVVEPPLVDPDVPCAGRP
jgi:hypothetical protein